MQCRADVIPRDLNGIENELNFSEAEAAPVVSGGEAETFSKAWYDHKEELQRQREQATRWQLGCTFGTCWNMWGLFVFGICWLLVDWLFVWSFQVIEQLLDADVEENAIMDQVELSVDVGCTRAGTSRNGPSYGNSFSRNVLSTSLPSK